MYCIHCQEYEEFNGQFATITPQLTHSTLALLYERFTVDTVIEPLREPLDLQIEDITLSSKMELLFQNKTSTNFILRAEKKDIKCHKVILACRSQFFRSMLSSNMTEVTTGMMTFNEPEEDCGIGFPALSGFVHYLYTNDVEHLKDPTDSLQIISIQEYLLLSHEEKHANLLKYCQNIVKNGITIANCLHFFKYSHQMEAKEHEVTSFILDYYMN